MIVAITIDVRDWRDVEVGEQQGVMRCIIRRVLQAADDEAEKQDIVVKADWEVVKT
jgi:hypothetical protein